MEKKGQLWFAVQFILFYAMLVSPFVGQFECPLWLRALGLAVSISGKMVSVRGYRTLGNNTHLGQLRERAAIQ